MAEKQSSGFQNETLVLVAGEDDFLVSRALEKIRNEIVAPDFADFNFNQFYGAKTAAGEILESAETFPLLSAKRLIFVREADRIPAGEMEKLLPYIERPAPSACLVFIASKTDMRKSFFSRLRDRGRLVSCDKLYENQVAGWIRGYLKEIALEADENAILYLKQEFGSDLFRLSAEIGKIRVFTGEKRKIAIADCIAVSKGDQGCPPFDLVNAVGDREATNALKRLHSLLEAGEQPLGLLFLLVRHFRNAMRLKEMQVRKMSRMEMGKKLQIPDFFFSNFLRQAGLFSRSELEAALGLCLEADSQLKNNIHRPERVMESLILDLCGKKPVYSGQGLLGVRV